MRVVLSDRKKRESRPFGLNWLINTFILSCPTYQSAALAHEGSRYHTPSSPSRSGTFAEQKCVSSPPCKRQTVHIIASLTTLGDIILELKYLMALLQTMVLYIMYKCITRSKVKVMVNVTVSYEKCFTCITAYGQDLPSQYGCLSQRIFEQLLKYVSSSPPAILQNVIGQVQQ